jgi:phenylalanyl-tRNA synthetase beta chain
MRTSIKWLKDYVDFSQSAEELADMLTMAGVPVENIEYPGRGLENIVTGRITEMTAHPNADKLTVCKLDIGRSEPLTIVTGATNLTVGAIVPVALVGAKLAGGLAIEATSLRGVESKGMLCSADELGMDAKIVPPEMRDGIYILPADTPVGVDALEAMGLDDVILEFELTPNRADCFSVIGLAREVAALTGGTLKKPMLTLKEEGTEKAANLATIAIDEPALCSRFCGRIFQNVKIGPSPAWLQRRVQAAGMRPISNVVDVTNFVMMEMGQPMHAYDYNLLAKHSLTARKARPGERLTTLDGSKRELDPDMLVIADAVQSVGVAGVMGGLATEVTAGTRTVLLEAASFNGASIRRTSKALGLRSEASGRYERGIDTANIIRPLDRAAQLLEQMGACTVCPGIIDVYPDVQLPRQVTFTPEQINSRLGVEVPQATMVNILKRLEFEVEVKADKIQVTVPTWRGDVSRPADISEEIARVWGYDNIPTTIPCGITKPGTQSYSQSIIDRIKDGLTGMGFSEAINFSFSHPAVFDKLNLPDDSELRQAIPILNPITDEFPLLKTTLMGGVMQTVAGNLARKNDDLKLYEIGAVYRPQSLPLTSLPTEPVMLCGAMCGKRYELAWNQGRDTVDFYDAKGVVEALLAKLGIGGYSVELGEAVAMHPGKTALFVKDGDLLGSVGEAHPKVQDAFGLNRRVCLFEFDVSMLVKHAVLIGDYRPLPRFPAIARDLAVVLPASVPASQVAAAITASGGDLLADVRLFDMYTGEQVPAGAKSLAFALVFRAADRTLTDEEVDGHYREIVAHLEKAVSAKLRV